MKNQVRFGVYLKKKKNEKQTTIRFLKNACFVFGNVSSPPFCNDITTLVNMFMFMFFFFVPTQN